MTKIVTLKGNWYEDGYLRDARTLDVVIADDGSLHDAELFDLGEGRLTVDADGEITGWSKGIRFVPDVGQPPRTHVA